jgi:hypothetical protein
MRTAACSCGQLTAVTSEDPVRVSICHCLACQRRTGSAFGTQARFRKEAVNIRGQASDYFCPICGATVHYSIESHEELVAIPVGAFAEPTFPAPAFSVYEKRKHSWVGVFGVIWMHAPLLHVVAFSMVLCIPTMIIAWAASRLARKFEKNARHVSSEA